ncbi:protein kinase domain-containing protein [Streptomonospora litoralis]|uniref:non-specific serine/threonine protein kinase n=1 Tax=Streptomonospora litoralis TaxID=2498135 RepID=A0A4P6Q6H6_9ACTN|nr:protein kinase [Streptomonospora litoralis]QBI56325.1 Serine/threonine-protein kinase PknK [Streptomonospora litoralis]
MSDHSDRGRPAAWSVPGVHTPEPLYSGADSVLYRAKRGPGDVSVVVKLARSRGPFEQRDEIELWRMHSANRGVHSLLQHGTTEGGRPYAVMEECPDGDYGRILAEEGPLSPTEAVTVGAEVAEALAAVHSRGLLHHAVAPENILRARFGPALIDFGSALTLNHPFPPVHYRDGVLEHAPPEELSGGTPGTASDVYRLASTVWTLLAGHAPFADGREVSAAAYRARVLGSPPPRVPRDDTPEWLQRVLLYALATDPGERLSSATDLARMLRSEGVSAPGLDSPAEPHRRELRRPGARPQDWGAAGPAAAGVFRDGQGETSEPARKLPAVEDAAESGDHQSPRGDRAAQEGEIDAPAAQERSFADPVAPYVREAAESAGTAAKEPEVSAGKEGLDAVPEPPYALHAADAAPARGTDGDTGEGLGVSAGGGPAAYGRGFQRGPGRGSGTAGRPRRRVGRAALFALALAALLVAVSGLAWWASSLLPSLMPDAPPPQAGAEPSAQRQAEPSAPGGQAPAADAPGGAQAAEDAAQDAEGDGGGAAAAGARSPQPSPGTSPADFAPTDVELRDGNISVMLTWADNTRGAATHFIVGGPVGADEDTTMAGLAAGETDVEITGLNPEVEYCFRVVAVRSTELAATSEEVCTDRDTRQ